MAGEAAMVVAVMVVAVATDAVGRHGLLDLYGCDAALLADCAFLENTLRRAAQTCGATILFSHFHPFGEGAGVTGVLLLAESHISIHTWPETGFAAVDMFLCGRMDMAAARESVRTQLNATHSDWRVELRGKR